MVRSKTTSSPSRAGRGSPGSREVRGAPGSGAPVTSGPLLVLAGGRVDADQVALVHEQRDLDLTAGLQGGGLGPAAGAVALQARDRKSTRLNSSHEAIPLAVFCLKKKSCTDHDTTDLTC